MPLYIRLVRLTEQGKIDMGKSPGKLSDDAGKILEKYGARRLHTWATMGRYDFVVVVEAPDDKAAMQISAEVGALGGAHVETLTAIPTDEFLGEG